MDKPTHLLVLVVLCAYTILVILLVFRNNRLLRGHHACSDVCTPLAKVFAKLMDADDATRTSTIRTLNATEFTSVRIIVFDPSGKVLCDSGAKTSSSSTQEIGDIFTAATSKQKGPVLVHRSDGSVMSYISGVSCKNGMVVASEALATD